MPFCDVLPAPLLLIPTKRSRTPGVYRIRLTVDDRSYIGSSVNVGERWIQHRRDLRKGTHHSVYLQRAWNKYGENAFVFELMEVCEPTREALTTCEQQWMDSTSPAFNMAKVAGSVLGVRHTAKTRQRNSDAHIGLDNHWTGRRHTAEARAKMSAARKGRSPSKAPPPVSDATREKIRAARTGSKASPETRAKMSASQSGRRHSEETRAKMSESARRRWEATTAERMEEIRSNMTVAAREGVARRRGAKPSEASANKPCSID